MTEREFLTWVEFFRLFPFDDVHRYHRPAAAIAASFGGKVEDVLAFLAPDPMPDNLSDTDAQVLRAFGITRG